MCSKNINLISEFLFLKAVSWKQFVFSELMKLLRSPYLLLPSSLFITKPFFYENSLLTCASFFIKFLFNAPPLIMTIIEKQTTVSARHKHSFQSHIQTSYVLWKKFKPQWNQWKCIYLDDKIWTHFLSWLRTNWCFFQCSTTENIDGNNCIIFVITFFFWLILKKLTCSSVSCSQI